jgi:prepilin-type N-terminal cleavage/methylation domain-containing protein/prepilin-type processing-associated H-X9-DG protein
MMNHSHYRGFSKATGFTLIELLIVISIIAMLASLLLPAIQTGIQKSQAAKCMSNLRQIGVAVSQYIADPDNLSQFPPIYNVGTSNNTNISYATNIDTSSLQPLQCLSNYGVTLALLTCPSDQNPNTNYGSYIWSPVLQGEQPQDVHVYHRGGVFTISKLSKMTVCTDNGIPHLGKFNVLRADGHVETWPQSN